MCKVFFFCPYINFGQVFSNICNLGYINTGALVKVIHKTNLRLFIVHFKHSINILLSIKLQSVYLFN